MYIYKDVYIFKFLSFSISKNTKNDFIELHKKFQPEQNVGKSIFEKFKTYF